MNASQATYEFGPFCLDGNKKLLWRDGEPVALTPKVLDTLLSLIELRDRVVTKDELLERVWGGTVVEEGGLARNISILRKALGEKPDQHTYIVTVPGKGYRFVADVREAAGTGARGRACARRPCSCSGPGIKPRVSRWLLLGGLAALAAGVSGLPLAPSARRASGTTGDYFARSTAAGKSVRRPGAGILRRRHDRSAHRQPCPYPRAARRLAHVGDAVQRWHPLSS